MNEVLIIQTPWTGAGTEQDPNRPKLTDAYIGNYEDVTSQPTANIPPSDNVFSCRFTCDLATADAIQTDSDYYIQSWVSE